MPKTIDFYFDFSSPWTYLAETQIESLAKKFGATVNYRPLFLGGLFKTTGHTPTFNSPMKWKYSQADMRDWADHYGVPFRFPTRFPLNTIKALRAVAAIQAAGKNPQPFLSAAFRAYWAEDADIASPEVLAGLLAKTGFDAQAILMATDTEAIKNAVKESTDSGHARGVFGAPTFFVGDKMFWGNDRLLFVEKALKG